MLRADAPEPTPEYREWLDERVEEGVPEEAELAAGRVEAASCSQPAALVGMVAAAVLVLVRRRSAAGRAGLRTTPLAAAAGRRRVAGGGGGSVAASAVAAAAHEPAPEVVDPRASAKSGRRRGQGTRPPSPGVALPPPARGFAPGRSDRKIERSVALELEMPVDEMARVAEQVTTVTNRHGGFVLSSSVSTGDDSAGGDFDLRIPATRLRPALRDLAALADVRTQSQTGRDVTRAARDREGPAPGRARGAPQPAAPARGGHDGRGGRGDPPPAGPGGRGDQRPPRPAPQPAPAHRLRGRDREPAARGRR